MRVIIGIDKRKDRKNPTEEDSYVFLTNIFNPDIIPNIGDTIQIYTIFDSYQVTQRNIVYLVEGETIVNITVIKL